MNQLPITEVRPSYVWANIQTGQTASIYGSCPWFSDSEKANWEKRQTGFTWVRKDGTIGLGRIPAKTEAEAIEVMNEINNKYLERISA